MSRSYARQYEYGTNVFSRPYPYDQLIRLLSCTSEEKEHVITNGIGGALQLYERCLRGDLRPSDREVDQVFEEILEAAEDLLLVIDPPDPVEEAYKTLLRDNKPDPGEAERQSGFHDHEFLRLLAATERDPREVEEVCNRLVKALGLRADSGGPSRLPELVAARLLARAGTYAEERGPFQDVPEPERHQVSFSGVEPLEVIDYHPELKIQRLLESLEAIKSKAADFQRRRNKKLRLFRERLRNIPRFEWDEDTGLDQHIEDIKLIYVFSSKKYLDYEYALQDYELRATTSVLKKEYRQLLRDLRGSRGSVTSVGGDGKDNGGENRGVSPNKGDTALNAFVIEARRTYYLARGKDSGKACYEFVRSCVSGLAEIISDPVRARRVGVSGSDTARIRRRCERLTDYNSGLEYILSRMEELPPRRALQVLGLDGNEDEAVEEAFERLIAPLHPDRGTCGGNDAAKLIRAREVLTADRAG